MLVHHLNCGTQCVLGGRLVGGSGSLTRRVPLVCHCLLIETNSGLVLVDTGLGLQDIEFPQQRLGWKFLLLASPQLDPDQTAVSQVKRLGFSTEDVRHIIVTHLDLDHVGGLSDFPLAQVHLHAAEWEAASHPISWQARYRYRPQQWSHSPRWVRYRVRGERWKGFECVRQLEGLPPEILLVPLVGHTKGHTGVAVQTQGRWLLHVGDAYYYRGEIARHQPHCPLGLALIQKLGAVDDKARRLNMQRLRQLSLASAQDVCIFCAHDPVEFERQSGTHSSLGS